jgi:hypothetical protein
MGYGTGLLLSQGGKIFKPPSQLVSICPTLVLVKALYQCWVKINFNLIYGASRIVII